jgi:hypothetical protein
MERYTAMYPRVQPSFPDDPVTTYVNNLRVTGATSGSAALQRAPTTRWHDPTCECNICVVLASSSSDPEPTPRHHATDAQRRA